MRHLSWGVPGISPHGGFPLSTGNSFFSKGMTISLLYVSSLTILFKRTSIYVFFPTDIRKWWNSAPMSPKRLFSTLDNLYNSFCTISLSLKINCFDKFRNLKLRDLLWRYRSRYWSCPSRGWHTSLLSFGSFYNVSPGIPLCHCFARLLKCVLEFVHSSLRRMWRQSSAFYSSFQSKPSSAFCKDDIAVMQGRGWLMTAAVQAAILQVLSSRFLIQILSVARDHRW